MQRSSCFFRRIFFFSLILTSYTALSQNWVAQNASSFSWRFEDVFFIDEQEGWACDGGGQIIHTTNGGEDWNMQYYNSNRYFRAIEFFDSELGFAGTLDTALFRTDDGGETWVNINDSLPTVPGGICGMSVADENTIFITGIFYGSAYYMKSTDRGDTWTYHSMAAYANGLVDVHFKNVNEGYLVGQSAVGTGLKAIILRTTDGGDNWTQVAISEESNERAWKIQFLNNDVAYVSIEELTPYPIYFKTVDGGANWTFEQPVTELVQDGTIQGIGFINDTLGWMGGFGDILFETTDGGNTWQYQPGIVQSFNRIWKLNETTMIAGGLTMYEYTDTTLNTSTRIIEPAKGHSFGLAGANPATSPAVVELELVNTTWCEVSLYDLQGRQVQLIDAQMRSQGEHRIDFSYDLPAGTYLLALYTYHGMETKRVVLSEVR